VLLTLFLLYTTATVLIGVFGEETATMETLNAALCVYLLMGFIWGGLYGLIYLLAPGAFHLPTGWTPSREQGIATDVPMNLMMYFSFTTLTTLGYGDVLPMSGSAGAAVMLEAGARPFLPGCPRRQTGRFAYRRHAPSIVEGRAPF
jgi:voltage-gated potassium channel